MRAIRFRGKALEEDFVEEGVWVYGYLTFSFANKRYEIKGHTIL